jgi:hypothetical protein
MVGVCSCSWPSPHMAFDRWSCPLSEVLHAQQSRRSRPSPDRLKATTIARTCLAGSGCHLRCVPSGTPPMPVAITETRLQNDHTRAMNLCSAHNPPCLLRFCYVGSRRPISATGSFTRPSTRSFVEVGDRLRPLLPSTCIIREAPAVGSRPPGAFSSHNRPQGLHQRTGSPRYHSCSASRPWGILRPRTNITVGKYPRGLDAYKKAKDWNGGSLCSPSRSPLFYYLPSTPLFAV